MKPALDDKTALDQAMACAPFFWQDDHMPEERRAPGEQTTAEKAVMAFTLPEEGYIIHVTGTANGPQGAYAVECTLTVRLRDGKPAVTLTTEQDIIQARVFLVDQVCREYARLQEAITRGVYRQQGRHLKQVLHDMEQWAQSQGKCFIIADGICSLEPITAEMLPTGNEDEESEDEV